MNFKNKIKSYYSRALVKSINIFRTFFYAGHAVRCLICKWEGKHFFNEKCPRCSSLPRTRLVPFSLEHFDLIKNNLKILHIAPNMNEYNYVKANFKKFLCYDRLDIKKRKQINIRQSVTKMDLANNTYDLVIAWHVFEHIKEDISAISEIYRVLKDKGSFLVCVPIYPMGNTISYEDSKIEQSDYTKIHGHYDHCRSCGLDYYKRFEAVGFKTKTLFVNSLDQSKQEYFGLRVYHVVWCFHK